MPPVVFRLNEIVDPGLATQLGSLTLDGQEFVWTEANQALPEEGWKRPREMRMVKTKYPNNDQPEFQILGRDLGDQKFVGMWADRFMGPGEARRTCDRFEAMMDRGSLVRIEFLGRSEYGYVSGFEPDDKFAGPDGDADEIRYEFTFQVSHELPGASQQAPSRRKATQAALRVPADLFAMADKYVDQLQALQDDTASGGFTVDWYNQVGSGLAVVTLR